MTSAACSASPRTSASPIRSASRQTANYPAYDRNFRGANPFPIDIIVDRDGTIAYIAREYDPDAMTAVIDRLLAKRLRPERGAKSPSESERAVAGRHLRATSYARLPQRA